MKHWTHGHSVATGLILGLSLAAHAWLFVVGGIIVGFIARDVWAVRGYVARRFSDRRPGYITAPAKSYRPRERW